MGVYNGMKKSLEPRAF